MPRPLQALLTVSWILLVAAPGALAQQPQVYYTPSAGAAASAPSAPSLQYISGGTLGVSNYYVKVTFVSPGGETTASSESSLLSVPANKLLVVASPSGANATGWEPYVWTSSGNEELQSVSGNCTLNTAGNACAIGSNWTEPAGGLTSGSAPPSTNTTGLYVNLNIGAFFCGTTLVSNAPGALAMAASATNYVYLDGTASCVAAKSTTAFPSTGLPIATVVTSATAVTSLTTSATWLPHAPTVVEVLPPSGTSTTADVQISSCIAALPPTGGICDARGLTGTQTIASTITLNKPVTLLLGAATFTVTATLPAFQINVNGVSILGSGFGETLIQLPNANGDLFAIGKHNTQPPDTLVTYFRVENLIITVPSTGLTADRTGAIFNLNYSAGGGTHFQQIRFIGDGTYNSGDIFYDSRATSDGGQVQTARIYVAGTWNTLFNLGCSVSGSTTGSFHSEEIMSQSASFVQAEFLLDGGTDTFEVVNSELGNALSTSGPAIWLQNTNGNSINPRLVTFDNVFMQNGSGGIGTLARIDAAKSFRLMNSYLTGAVCGVTVGGSTQDTNLSGNTFTELSCNAVVVSPGALKTSIQNNTFADTNIDSTGCTTFPKSVIHLRTNTNYVQIIGNRLTTQGASTKPANFIDVASGSSGFLVITGNDLGVAGTDYSGSNAINLNSDSSALYTIADNTPFEAFHLVAGGSDNQFHFIQMIGGSPVENWKIDTNGNLIEPLSTSLGIGTTGPLSRLDVNGGVAVGSYAGSNAAPSNGLIVSGNVGIGTAGPVSALNVAGTTGLTWTSGSHNFGLVTIGSPGTGGSTGGSLYINTASLSAGDYESGLGIDGTYGTPSYQSVINIKAMGVHSGGAYGSQLAFWTTNGTALNQQMTIDKAGNVGIGTTTPGVQLQVDKAIGAGVNSVSFSATPAFDASKGNTQTITLTGNVSSWSISNPTSGEWLIIQWCQDSNGLHTVAGTPSNVKGFTTPGTTASTCSQQIFSYNGTNWYALAIGTSNL